MTRRHLALSLVTGLLAGCGHYGPPTRTSAESRLETRQAAPAVIEAVEAGPGADEECEEEEAAKKKATP